MKTTTITNTSTNNQKSNYQLVLSKGRYTEMMSIMEFMQKNGYFKFIKFDLSDDYKTPDMQWFREIYPCTKDEYMQLTEGGKRAAAQDNSLLGAGYIPKYAADIEAYAETGQVGRYEAFGLPMAQCNGKLVVSQPWGFAKCIGDKGEFLVAMNTSTFEEKKRIQLDAIKAQMREERRVKLAATTVLSAKEKLEAASESAKPKIAATTILTAKDKLSACRKPAFRR